MFAFDFGPVHVWDLGVGNIGNFLDAPTDLPAPAPEVSVNPGHVYLINHQALLRWLLIRVIDVK